MPLHTPRASRAAGTRAGDVPRGRPGVRDGGAGAGFADGRLRRRPETDQRRRRRSQLPPGVPPARILPEAARRSCSSVGTSSARAETYLLQAFAEVRRKLPAATLSVVGSSAGAGLHGVHSHGKVTSREELAEIYRGARVACVPSRYEPYGLALIEAMAHSVPVRRQRSVNRFQKFSTKVARVFSFRRVTQPRWLPPSSTCSPTMSAPHRWEQPAGCGSSESSRGTVSPTEWPRSSASLFRPLLGDELQSLLVDPGKRPADAREGQVSLDSGLRFGAQAREAPHGRHLVPRSRSRLRAPQARR